jgi:hypothetical protein
MGFKFARYHSFLCFFIILFVNRYCTCGGFNHCIIFFYCSIPQVQYNFNQYGVGWDNLNCFFSCCCYLDRPVYLSELIEIRSWVQSSPPFPSFAVVQLRYCFELVLDYWRINSAAILVLETPYISGNVI